MKNIFLRLYNNGDLKIKGEVEEINTYLKFFLNGNIKITEIIEGSTLPKNVIMRIKDNKLYIKGEIEECFSIK